MTAFAGLQTAALLGTTSGKPTVHRHVCKPAQLVTCRQRLVLVASSVNGASNGAALAGGQADAHEPGAGAGPNYSIVQRNLALELVRVTEAAALAGGRWLGRGDKNAADQAAVDQMRKVLNTVAMDGIVVIGEGEKDEAPMLYCGEQIGCASEPLCDIAVDPLDGTTLVSQGGCSSSWMQDLHREHMHAAVLQGRNGAVAVIAVAERGALFDPGPCMYMEKLAVGPVVNPRSVSLNRSTYANVRAVAEAQGKSVADVTVVILDRPRHADMIREIRETGCRIKLISDGDVAAAIEVAKAGAAADMLLGIGGTPEGVIAAAALRCMGGHMQGRLWPRNPEEGAAALKAGYDLDKILHTHDLAAGDQIFFAATGVSDGDLLRGVRYIAGGATTNSIVMRHQSGTVRVLETQHRWERPGVTNPEFYSADSGFAHYSGSGSVAGRIVQP